MCGYTWPLLLPTCLANLRLIILKGMIFAMSDNPNRQWNGAQWMVWDGEQWRVEATPPPAKNNNTLGGCLVLIVFLLLVGGCTALVFGGDDSTDNGITAYVACQLEVETVLKSPGTADWPALQLATHTNEGNVWKFRSYVDSQNSFGGVVRTNYACDSTVTGDSGKVTSLVVDGQKIR
jgi:hypothetical protein